VNGPKIVIVAGETSGEAHAARLARALKQRNPDCRLYGVGGGAMRAAGVELLAECDVGVIGFAEVFRHLPALLRVERRVARFFREERPDLFIPVDYPGFNLRMCRLAKRAGIPVMYYISPQVWAWARGRVGKIARRVDLMVTILPFEKHFYEKAGVRVEFVGHPLLEALEEEETGGRRVVGPGSGPERRVLGLLPGSRENEVGRLFPIMLKAAAALREEFPEIHARVAAASPERANQLRRMIPEGYSWVSIVTGRSREVIRESELVLVASGTATLEAACLETPMVVVYRLSLLSWLIARALIRVPDIALANLVAGRRVVPELVQYEATPRNLARAAGALLRSEARRTEIRVSLKGVRGRLGTPGASTRVADLALSLASGAGAAGPTGGRTG